MRKQFFLAAVSLAFLRAVPSCFALQVHPLIDQHKTDLKISQNQQNRIAVSGDRISQIFGAEGTFDVQSDDAGGQIFVRLVDPARAKPITLTLITESGVTHDCTLIPADIEFQSILFKPQIGDGAESFKTHEEETSPMSSHVERLSRLMKSMAAGSQLEGYRLSKLNTTDRNYPEPLKVIPQALYQSEELEGRVYVLKNEGDALISLSEEALALPQDIALSVSCRYLNPGEKGSLLVISKRGKGEDFR